MGTSQKPISSEYSVGWIRPGQGTIAVLSRLLGQYASSWVWRPRLCFLFLFEVCIVCIVCIMINYFKTRTEWSWLQHACWEEYHFESCTSAHSSEQTRKTRFCHPLGQPCREFCFYPASLSCPLCPWTPQSSVKRWYLLRWAHSLFQLIPAEHQSSFIYSVARFVVVYLFIFLLFWCYLRKYMSVSECSDTHTWTTSHHTPPTTTTNKQEHTSLLALLFVCVLLQDLLLLVYFYFFLLFLVLFAKPHECEWVQRYTHMNNKPSHTTTNNKITRAPSLCLRDCCFVLLQQDSQFN